MDITRRSMLGASAALVAAGPGLAKAAATAHGNGAIQIDGLGGLIDSYSPPDVSRLSVRGWSEMLRSGLSAVRDTVAPVGNVADPWGEFQKGVEPFNQIVAANPDRLIMVRKAADIERAKRDRMLGLILGTQDSSMIGPDLDHVAEIKKAGVTCIQLTYNNANLAGDGALEPRDAGLTRLGRRTIERIEAEKLLLDLSHGGARTMAEAAAAAKRPLTISHTGARALIDHPRNTADATIRAVADKGGVVGVYFMPFLAIGRPATLADVVAHVEHVARVAGEEHVGIGSDNGPSAQGIDAEQRKQQDDNTRERMRRGIASPGEGPGIYPWIDDLNSSDRYAKLASALRANGWTSARVEKLLGGNLLRLYREVWGA